VILTGSGVCLAVGLAIGLLAIARRDRASP
jgi:hypothetical protein